MSYLKHEFKLSEDQVKKVVEAVTNTEAITLKLTPDKYTDGSIPLPLTKQDAQKITDNKSFDYSLNKAKLQHMGLEPQKDGGFLPILPLILAGIGAVATATGAAAGVATAVINKKSNDTKQEEEGCHNLEMEKIARGGDGLYLNPYLKGDGLRESLKTFSNSTNMDEVSKKVFRNFFKNLSKHIGIRKEGDGLFLSPIL